MKVKMLRSTYWQGIKVKPGDAVDVALDVAARWEKAGIAGRVKEKNPNEKKPEA